LQTLRSLFETCKRSEADRQLSNCDIHCVTGLLKLYFRQLPHPLFTEVLYTEFIAAISNHDEKIRRENMIKCLNKLKNDHTANFQTLTRLVEHFLVVAKNEEFNKMSAYNLATIFGPTLMWPDNSSNQAQFEWWKLTMNVRFFFKQICIVTYYHGIPFSNTPFIFHKYMQ